MNADGSNQTRLSPLDNTAMNDIFPSFSWDGREIVFVGWDSTASAYGIWIMNIDGSNRASVIVPATIPVTPAFRPPRTFAYEILWVDNGEIASIFQGGSGQTTLTNSGGTIEELMVLGKEVWFTTTQDGNPEVYKMNGDGTGQRNMTNNQYADRIDMNVP
jgi:TolB protein